MQSIKYPFLFSLVLTVIAITGCPSHQSTQSAPVSLNGSGATFPYPIYSAWAYTYEEISGTKINYQGIGSGGGISSIEEKTVDFGATDNPLQVDELNAHGLLQFPMIIGGIVPVINVPGFNPGQLKLSGDALAKIFLGEITNWSSPSIAGLNPDLSLPDLDITVAHRADGSGTTWIFSSYLDKVSTDWHERVGAGKSLDWPVGLGANKNEGVAQNVQTVPGSIGYVEFAYAGQNNLTYCQLQNKDGNFVEPSIETFSDAAANADWVNAPGFYMELVDQPGANSWPIVGASFILIYKDQADSSIGKGMLDFFDWCFMHGSEQAIELDYVPIPDNVIEMIRAKWSSEITSGGQKIRG
ncbi:MAG: phosphate ABC transporter substrate-binding protein PstS [bacterium]|nr:phosphate ABC transporter substrate-binding protein PstS [bacterium]